MSFLGKILIVAQVVLSLLFMCAAGAVFTSHVSWRDEFNKKDADYKTLQSTHATELTNLNQKIDGLTQSQLNEKNRADAQVGRVQQLEQENGALKQDKNALNQQLQTATGLSEAKSSEAEFRQAEAERMRVQFETVSKSLDEQIRKTVALEDELGTQKAVYDELTTQHNALQEEAEFLRRVVRTNNLSTDRQTVELLAEPPPPVEGLVREIRKDQTNRTKWVHLTVGSDDGLRAGHEMEVYRTAERNNGRAKYLGRIRIWSVTPDEAVGIVVDAAKNGIIEVGDNVTTKL